MKLYCIMAIIIVLAAACGQDLSSGDSEPPVQTQQPPAPAATAVPAPEPPTPVPPTPRPPPPPALAPTAAPAPTQLPATPSATPLALAGRITPTATATPWPTPTPVPKAARTVELSELALEYRERCKHWVRGLGDGITYVEFLTLEPETMSDLDRVLWRDVLDNYVQFCQDYLSEPLSSGNADKRNESYRGACYERLWEQRGWRDSNGSWDQYSRIANWLDIPGGELLEMSPRPLDLVQTAWERSERGQETDPEDEWHGILEAWPIADDDLQPSDRWGRNNDSEECVAYYPQLFTGRWIPLDTAITCQEMQESRRMETPTPTPSDMRRWIGQRDRPVFMRN